MASPNLSELVTTTLQHRTGKLKDNLSKSRMLLDRLNKKGNVDTVPGGRTIVQELEYAENGTFRRYSGYDQLNIAPSDVFSGAEFDFKQAAAAVAMSGQEMMQNSGKDAVIGLLKARIKNAEKTIVNNIAGDIFSDGTADGGRQIGGLQLLISNSPTTGTVGGISRSQWAFWQNMVASGTTVTAANIQSLMNGLAIKTTRGTDRCDLIVADDNFYNFYLQSLQAMQRITTEPSGHAGAGFSSLKYFGVGGDTDVVLERSSGPFSNAGIPASRMFFLNTDYIYFRPHAKRNFVVDDQERTNVNQDAMTKLIFWMGNMTIANAALQGVLTN